MSVVGKRQHPDPNSKRMPALVISRVPIDPATAPPKASPRKPVRKKRSRATASPSKNKQQQTKSITIASSPSMARKNSYIVISNPPTFPSFSAQKPKPVVPLWEYLKTYLPKETRYPQETVLKELLSFPRQRELPHRWKLQISGFKQRLDNKTLAAVSVTRIPNAAELVGWVLNPLLYLNLSGEGSCQSPFRSVSPYLIALPKRQGSISGRSEVARGAARVLSRGSSVLTEDEDDDEEEEDEEGIETSEDVLAMELEKAQQHLKKTQVNKVQEDEETEEEEAEEESEESPTPTPEPRGTRRSGRLAKTTAATATTRTTTSKTTATRSNARGERPPGAPIESYMMSEWEMVPGRIRVGTGSRAENIAFSSTYLAHSHVSPVSMTSNGISFQLLNIQPGKPVQWPSSNKNDQDDDTTRICSVAQGIVNVKVAGREFPLGPNGVWKVSPGQKCEVGSVWYGGAVVHVVRVQEAEEEYEE
ncbi:hypothetical protein QBC35DRAFT_388505 [Podospora australis]|uniref:Uncharacterized protein n=1 Tax=Podospora australis TaxID=1536484 RepID=A0AAN7AH83_9PEZI|nr:hypothetical protein QBC35DRAFT_388505 [Podospora australis]